MGTICPGFFALFFQHYTLHDSRFIALYRNDDGDGIAIFRWDVAWQEGKIPYHQGGMEQSPLLFIKFEILLNAYSINGIELLPSIFHGNIAHAFTEIVRGIQGDCYYTEIELDYGEFQIIHAGQTWLFCMNHSGTPLPIPF